MSDSLHHIPDSPPGSTSCPSCRHTLGYYDRKKAVVFGCPECGCVFNREGGSTSVLRTFDAGTRKRPDLPLGTKGMVHDKEYVLTGYVYKKQKDDDIYWSEYLFYNEGDDWYLTLAEYNGHWMMVERSPNQYLHIQERSSDHDFYVIDQGRTHHLYLRYSFDVLDAEGEFDWNVIEDERLVTYEYVAAPYILINEQKGDRPSWFIGQYVSVADLCEAFEIKKEGLPAREHPGHFNPKTFYPRWRPLLNFSVVMVSLVIVVSMVDAFVKPTKRVFGGQYNCELDTGANPGCKPVITPPFDIDGPASVAVALSSATVDNNWMEIPFVLVNDNTGKAYEVDKVLEYYHGYDDGESWDEGSKAGTVALSSVPSGSYHLNIYPALDINVAQGAEFDISVNQHVFKTSNFLFTLMLLILYPFIQEIRKYRFEHSRWFDSEYGEFPH